MPCEFCGTQVDPVIVSTLAVELFDRIDSGEEFDLTYEEESVYNFLCCEACTRKFLLTA